jgi:hypothetical protein
MVARFRVVLFCVIVTILLPRAGLAAELRIYAADSLSAAFGEMIDMVVLSDNPVATRFALFVMSEQGAGDPAKARLRRSGDRGTVTRQPPSADRGGRLCDYAVRCETFFTTV